MSDKSKSKVFSRLEVYRAEIRQSQLFAATKAIDGDFVGLNFSLIRCLGLGSPTDSFPALYQLAYILELQNLWNCSVSMYDPVFTDSDLNLLEKLNFSVSELDDSDRENTLYYLPHVGLDVTSSLLEQKKPKYLLANHISHHTDLFTKSLLHEAHYIISHLKHLVDGDDYHAPEFTEVKKKRRNKKYVPPPVEYSFESMYFKSVKVISLGKFGEFQNAFNYLAYHHIE